MNINLKFFLILGLVALVVGGSYLFHSSLWPAQIITTQEAPHMITGAQLPMSTGTASAMVGANSTDAIETHTTATLPVVATHAMTTDTKTVPKVPALKTDATTATVLLADGCFWSTQRDLEEVTGVISTVAGYADGTTPNPNYQNYVAGGYREAVLVTYDPQVVSYANLVEHIIKHGDPTDSGGSFYDRGPEYVPAIYYSTQAEQAQALQVIAAVDALGVFKKPLPLLVIQKGSFYPAEDYHQDFAKKNPIRYNAYRLATGRDTFTEKYWGSAVGTFTVTETPS